MSTDLMLLGVTWGSCSWRGAKVGEVAAWRFGLPARAKEGDGWTWPRGPAALLPFSHETCALIYNRSLISINS